MRRRMDGMLGSGLLVGSEVAMGGLDLHVVKATGP
jgi:hypothetical protein